MSTHYREVCEYGQTHSQCRCPSPGKEIRAVQCDRPGLHRAVPVFPPAPSQQQQQPGPGTLEDTIQGIHAVLYPGTPPAAPADTLLKMLAEITAARSNTTELRLRRYT